MSENPSPGRGRTRTNTDGADLYPRSSAFVRVLPLLVFLVAAAVYGRTLARTFTWRNDGADGGDLIAAAATLGVPHPSGYPTYILLARLFLQALPWGEPAFRVHWLSALSGAAAAALLALSIVESLGATGRLTRQGEGERGCKGARVQRSKGAEENSPLLPSTSAPLLRRSPCPHVPLSPCPDLRWLTWVAAASASLIFAFSPLAWGQATIAEVHALNVFFVAALFWLLLRWRAQGAARLAVAAAFLYGLSLGNHLTGLLLLPAALLWLLAYSRPGLFNSRWKRRLRLTVWAWGGIIGACLLGLAVYAYLPLAAARQPPVNWGDPQTWDRFWWLVSGQLYREAIFGLPLAFIPGRLSAWGHLLLDQFGWWGWILALVGLWRLSQNNRAVLGFSLYVFAAYSVYAVTYDRADSYVYLLPACLMVAFWLGQGLITLLQAIRQWTQRAIAPRALPGALSPVALLLAALLPLLPLLGNFAAQDLRQEREAADFASAALAAAEPGGLIVTSGDRDTFALWYHRYALGARPDVTILNANLWGFDWYRRTLAAHHPEVILLHGDSPPPTLPELIQANVNRRPVYATEEARAAMGDYELEPAGPLYRLLP